MLCVPSSSTSSVWTELDVHGEDETNCIFQAGPGRPILQSSFLGPGLVPGFSVQGTRLQRVLWGLWDCSCVPGCIAHQIKV